MKEINENWSPNLIKKIFGRPHLEDLMEKNRNRNMKQIETNNNNDLEPFRESDLSKFSKNIQMEDFIPFDKTDIENSNFEGLIDVAKNRLKNFKQILSANADKINFRSKKDVGIRGK